MRSVPRLCEFNPGICLTTEEKHGKTSVRVEENCALLGCYSASIGNSLPTFRDNLSVPYSGVTSGIGITTTYCVIAQKSTVVSIINHCTQSDNKQRKTEIHIIVNKMKSKR